jgi:hypothetical protein
MFRTTTWQQNPLFFRQNLVLVGSFIILWSIHHSHAMRCLLCCLHLHT